MVGMDTLGKLILIKKKGRKEKKLRRKGRRKVEGRNLKPKEPD